jgi:hypothetical protein
VPVLGNNRRFAHAQDRVHHLKTTVDHTPYQADSHFEDFPTAPGDPPYHLDLGEILHQSEIDKIARAKKLVFHTTGDTGNFKKTIFSSRSLTCCEATPKHPTPSFSTTWAT